MTIERDSAFVCALLVSYLLHSTLLLAVAWGATRRMSSRLDRLAEQVWRAAIGLPILTTLAQHWIGSINAIGATRVGAIDYSPQPLTAALVPAFVWVGGAAIWMFGALIGLGQLYRCHRQLHRQIRHREPLAAWQREKVATLLGSSGIRVTLVNHLAVPCALTREICVPTWLVTRMTPSELRAVIAHEAAHVRRRDALWRPAVSAVVRLFFFQPLNWIAAERLRELSECICDDEAVAATKSAVPLATALETVAARTVRGRGRITLAPAMGAPASLTVRRVGRILADSSRATPPEISGGQQVVALMLAGAAAIAFAPRVSLPAIAFQRYTISAEDPAGRFTLTVERGRVVGATVGGRDLQPRQMRQKGAQLELAENGDAVFSVRLTPAGGISWDPRKPTDSGQ